MTHYCMELILKDWVNPFVDTSKWEYFDCSCKNRDATDDKVGGGGTADIKLKGRRGCDHATGGAGARSGNVVSQPHSQRSPAIPSAQFPHCLFTRYGHSFRP